MFDAADIDTGKDQTVLRGGVNEDEGAGFKAGVEALGGLFLLTKTPHGTAKGGAGYVGHAAPNEVIGSVLRDGGADKACRAD